MNRLALLICVAWSLSADCSFAQQPLLLDPAKAPITLKGGWEAKSGGDRLPQRRGDIAVKIAKINPDGTFEGRLDLFAILGGCKAIDEPIREGRISSNGLTVVANGGPSAVCGRMTLQFRRGKERFLQGRLKSEAGDGRPMWLDAPE